MHYTGPIFRPPVEAMLGSKLLQVTVGCAHNKCTFCSMYSSVDFSIENLNQVEEDIIELRNTFANIDRIFLINGDAFVLDKNKLVEIASLIIKHIPEIEVITMYASISNIKSKSDEDLIALRNMRINDLWMGIESGDEQTIIDINKGHTLEDVKEQLARLNNAGIRHNDSYMLGIAGTGKGQENAVATANIINETMPSVVWFGTTSILEGSPLYKDLENGVFNIATELEILEEEMKVLELIELENVPFYGIHPTNAVSISGLLPRDKNKMISKIKKSLDSFGEEFLYSSVDRNKRRNSM